MTKVTLYVILTAEHKTQITPSLHLEAKAPPCGFVLKYSVCTTQLLLIL